MRYHWIQDRIVQNHIELIWRQGNFSWADYFTKHLQTAYHRIMRSTYLLNKLNSLANDCAPLSPVRVCYKYPPSQIRTDHRHTFPVDEACHSNNPQMNALHRLVRIANNLAH